MKNLIVMTVLSVLILLIATVSGFPREQAETTVIVTLLFFIGTEIADLRSKIK